MKSVITLKISAIAIAALLLAGVAHAAVIWDGSASKGTGVFGNLNCVSPGTVTAVNDATFGRVWRFDKPAGDKRCEAHGAAGFHPAIGGTYYIGWRSRLTTTADDNANFQWKAFGRPLLQNFPLVLKMVSGQLQLHYFPPGGGDVTLWSRSISANTWYKVYLRIRVSDSTSGGSVSLWFNDAQQTLSNGSTSYTGKTFDGSSVDPKWGVYGATGTSLHDYVRHLRIGTALADVQF